MCPEAAPAVEGRFCDPVPVNTGGVSATSRDAAYASLRPDLTCEDNRCEIRMKGLIGGQTVLMEPLPFKSVLMEGDDWLPTPMSDEALTFGPFVSDYGWQLGYEENAIDIRVRSLQDPQYGPGGDRFLVAQTAGFDHLQTAYRVYKANDDYTGYKLVWQLGPSMGPQPLVEVNGGKGITVTKQVYDGDGAGDFVPQTTEYYWVYGDHGEALVSREDAKIELGVETDAELDALLNE